MDPLIPVALVQSAPVPGDAPFDVFADQVRAIAAAFPQVRLIVYPELHLMGASRSVRSDRNAELNALAQPLPGPRSSALGELAAELGLWLIPGTVCERGAHGELFNTAVVFSPTGELVASYRKIFPWRPYEPYQPGDRFVVFDLDGVTVGLSICYDAWFPELSRHLAWQGAKIIVNLVQTTTSDRAQELVLARANAIVNQVFMVSVNCAGPLGFGKSIMVDPEGLVRVEAASENPVVLTDVINTGEVDRVRRFGTAGLNRPWEQFQPGDQPLELPLYNGRIEPGRWNPQRASGTQIKGD